MPGTTAPASAIAARNIRYLRRERGWTLVELAEAASGKGLPSSPRTWRHIEDGRRSLTIPDLEATAALFGLGAADLLATAPPCPECARPGHGAPPAAITHTQFAAIREIHLVLDRKPTVRERAALQRAVIGEDGWVDENATVWVIHQGGDSLQEAADEVIDRVRAVRGFDAALDTTRPRYVAVVRRWLLGFDARVDGVGALQLSELGSGAVAAVRDFVAGRAGISDDIFDVSLEPYVSGGPAVVGATGEEPNDAP